MAEVALQLFTGPNCRLCEDALDLISPYVRAPYQLLKIDVTTSLELKKAYGLKIPVLRREDRGEELDWPFDSRQIEEFLS